MREWREEYGLTLDRPRLPGVLENVITYEGEPGHEIVFAFEARFVEPHVYTRNEIESVGTGGRHEAVWCPSPGFHAPGAIPLTPAGLLDLLQRTD